MEGEWLFESAESEQKAVCCFLEIQVETGVCECSTRDCHPHTVGQRKKNRILLRAGKSLHNSVYLLKSTLNGWYLMVHHSSV